MEPDDNLEVILNYLGRVRKLYNNLPELTHVVDKHGQRAFELTISILKTKLHNLLYVQLAQVLRSYFYYLMPDSVVKLNALQAIELSFPSIKMNYVLQLALNDTVWKRPDVKFDVLGKLEE